MITKTELTILIIIIMDTAKVTPICQKCSYRLSKLNETEYLTVKNMMQFLIISHWNVTSEFLNYYLDNPSKSCDQYFDHVAINQVKNKDFRHPNALFKHITKGLINQSVVLEYEIEWFEKFKMIRYDLQSEK